MFGIGWSEFVVIGVVALIAIGPKELPGVLRTIGFWVGKVRRMANEFQGQFQEALREAEMADVRKELEEISAKATDIKFDDPVAEANKEIATSFEARPEVAEPASAVPTEPVSADRLPDIPEIDVPLPEPVAAPTGAQVAPPADIKPSTDNALPESPEVSPKVPSKVASGGGA
jgi:sec-independent protein translocase protein TatB